MEQLISYLTGIASGACAVLAILFIGSDRIARLRSGSGKLHPPVEQADPAKESEEREHRRKEAELRRQLNEMMNYNPMRHYDENS